MASEKMGRFYFLIFREKNRPIFFICPLILTEALENKFAFLYGLSVFIY